MLEIDDSGWGCPIGGVLIGVLRPESEEYLTGLIPVRYFQGTSYQKLAYLAKTKSLAKDLIGRLKVGSREQIVVCPGPLFRNFRTYLFENKFNFRARPIGGALQLLVEKSFAQYLNGLGIPADLLARYNFRHAGGRFHALLRWVAQTWPERLAVCKTGWPSWPKWAQEIERERAKFQTAEEAT